MIENESARFFPTLMLKMKALVSKENRAGHAR
jgi:hypothetical protein